MSKTDTHHALPEDKPPPDLPPPSYHEAINSPVPGSLSSAQPSAPPRPPQRPPQQPPRPTVGSSSNSRPPQGISYSNNQGLPFEYPKRYLCKKCKNTGYKKEGRMCLDCWGRFYLPTHAYNPNPDLPFKYPKGFICEKCYNRGIKVKNGKTCKDCYARFAPRNNYTINPPGVSGPFMGPPSQPLVLPQPPFMPGGFPPAPQMPMRVPPGDPRLGGTLCGNCRGTGQVWFFLDSELCHVCGGLGRILNKY